MTRQDYRLIARVIAIDLPARTSGNGARYTKAEIADAFATALAFENEKFIRDKFLGLALGQAGEPRQ